MISVAPHLLVLHLSHHPGGEQTRSLAHLMALPPALAPYTYPTPVMLMSEARPLPPRVEITLALLLQTKAWCLSDSLFDM